MKYLMKQSLSLEVYRTAGPWSDCLFWKVQVSQTFGCTEEAVGELEVGTGSPEGAGCASPPGNAADLQPSPRTSGGETQWSCWDWALRTPHSVRLKPQGPLGLWSSPSGTGCVRTLGCPLLGTDGPGYVLVAARDCIQDLLPPTPGP